jgi:HAD superfamily hydrolase (TIGR01662 family)
VSVRAASRAPRAVFFDVDFTLIHPGPTFEGPGYRATCARYGIAVDAGRFSAAVAAAASLLEHGEGLYDPQIFVDYTRRIIEGMGGAGDRVEEAARDIYAEWSACHHFSMYEEVPEVIRDLHARGLVIGLISNTQRCLASFQSHFALDGLFSVAISSAAHGFMKPHPSIFQAALDRAGASVDQAVMVGDSLSHDIVGARRLGMRAVLVARSGSAAGCPADVPVISTLRELPPLL